MAAGLMLFLIIIPLLSFVMLFVLWAAPLTNDHKYTAYLVSEMLKSWAAVDVFLLTVLLSSKQIPIVVDHKVMNNSATRSSLHFVLLDMIVW